MKDALSNSSREECVGNMGGRAYKLVNFAVMKDAPPKPYNVAFAFVTVVKGQGVKLTVGRDAPNSFDKEDSAIVTVRG